MLTDHQKLNLKLDAIINDLIDLRVDALINQKLLLQLNHDTEIHHLRQEIKSALQKENDDRSAFFKSFE